MYEITLFWEKGSGFGVGKSTLILGHSTASPPWRRWKVAGVGSSIPKGCCSNTAGYHPLIQQDGGSTGSHPYPILWCSVGTLKMELDSNLHLPGLWRHLFLGECCDSHFPTSTCEMGSSSRDSSCFSDKAHFETGIPLLAKIPCSINRHSSANFHLVWPHLALPRKII